MVTEGEQWNIVAVPVKDLLLFLRRAHPMMVQLQRRQPLAKLELYDF